MEERVGAPLLAVEHAVEADPLGAGQRRLLHILGALDDGDVDLLQPAVAARVLEGREQQGVGLGVDDLLDQGAHAVAAVREAARGEPLADVGHLHILRVGHAGHLSLSPQLADEGGMDAGEDDRPPQRHPHHGDALLARRGRHLFARRGRHLFARRGRPLLARRGRPLLSGVARHCRVIRHEQIAMEHLPRLPGIVDGDQSAAVALGDVDEAGVLERNSSALVLPRRRSAGA